MAPVIEINGVKYPVRFGYGAIKYLGRLWGLGLTETLNMFSALDGMDEDNISFEHLDIFSQMARASLVYGAGKDVKDGDIPDSDTIMDAVMADNSKMSEFMKVISDSMPQADPGNLKAVPANKKAS